MMLEAEYPTTPRHRREADGRENGYNESGEENIDFSKPMRPVAGNDAAAIIDPDSVVKPCLHRTYDCYVKSGGTENNHNIQRTRRLSTPIRRNFLSGLILSRPLVT